MGRWTPERWAASSGIAFAILVSLASGLYPAARAAKLDPLFRRHDGAGSKPTTVSPDRLRPRSLDDVVGQDHILGPDGALTRMLETRTLGSLVFRGPPGHGKTPGARLLAGGAISVGWYGMSLLLVAIFGVSVAMSDMLVVTEV